MASISYKYLAFLIVFHAITFHAQSAGYLAEETPENRHKKVIDDFASNNLTANATVSTQSRIQQETGGLAGLLASIGIINSLIGILASPYSAINATALPTLLKTIITALTGFTEAFVIYQFIRGNV